MAPAVPGERIAPVAPSLPRVSELLAIRKINVVFVKAANNVMSYFIPCPYQAGKTTGATRARFTPQQKALMHSALSSLRKNLRLGTTPHSKRGGSAAPGHGVHVRHGGRGPVPGRSRL
jgi:hypothetical protein